MTNYITKIHSSPVLSNVLYLVTEKGVRFFIISLGNIYIARILGPSDFGTLNYVLSLSAILFSLSSLGLDQILIKLFSQEKNQYELLKTTTFLRLSITVPLSIAVLGISLLRQSPLYFQLFLASLFYVFASFDVISLYFIAQNKAKLSSIPASAAAVLAIFLKVLLAVVSAPLSLLFLANSFEKIGNSLLLLKNVQSELPHILNARFLDKKQLLSLLKESSPLLLSGIAVTLYMRIDQVLVKHFLSVADVGIYAAGVKISELWYFIPTAVITGYFPKIIREQKKGFDYFKKAVMRVTQINLLLAFTFALILTVFGKWIVLILFGADYLAATSVIQIYSWSALAVVVGLSLSHWLLTIGKQIITFYATLLGLIVNVVLNVVLIPEFGTTGAAVSTLVAYGIVTLVSLIYIKYTSLHT